MPNTLLRKLVSAYAFLKSCVRGMIDLSIDSKLNTGQEYAKKSSCFLQPTQLRLRKVENPRLLINIDCRQVTYQIDALCVNFSKIII